VKIKEVHDFVNCVMYKEAWLFGYLANDVRISHQETLTHTTVLWPFLWDYPGELVPKEIF